MASPAAKKRLLLELLSRGAVLLHLDARPDGVRVPRQHKGESHLRLNVAYGYRGLELYTDDLDLCCTLTFGAEPHRCVLPWSAVWGITAQGGKGDVWLEDVPVDVLERLGEQVEHARQRRRPRPPQLMN